MTAASIPTTLDDPTNAAILAVSEDRLQGFQVDPFGEIAARSSVDIDTVIERVRALLEAGTIRRVRQTVQATRLAAGALVAWKLPPEKLDAAFDFMVHNDPFSGHVVLRSTDGAAAGHDYRLWTTLKVPQGYSLQKHCRYLQAQTGAEAFHAMPAKSLFVLGVGHVRRRTIPPAANRRSAPKPSRRTSSNWMRRSGASSAPSSASSGHRRFAATSGSRGLKKRASAWMSSSMSPGSSKRTTSWAVFRRSSSTSSH